MLNDRDKDAIFALLIRLFDAQKRRDEHQALADHARSDVLKVRSALSVFGFDLSGEKPWRAVREAIGEARYRDALFTGKGVLTDARDDEAGNDAAPSTKIKDSVLRCLQRAGSNGAKVKEIRTYVASNGAEMHDKTVGMTLYRLAKEGLVRRDGRVWFAVDSGGDAD